MVCESLNFNYDTAQPVEAVDNKTPDPQLSSKGPKINLFYEHALLVLYMQYEKLQSSHQHSTQQIDDDITLTSAEATFPLKSLICKVTQLFTNYKFKYLPGLFVQFLA